MYLVDEKQRCGSGVGQSIRSGSYPPHVGEVGLNTAQPLEPALGLIGDDLRQAGFPVLPVKISD